MIRLALPGLPPSANNAYFNLPRGGRALTAEGKKYKNEMKTHLVRMYAKELQNLKPDVPYLIYIRFYFIEIENATWGKPKGAQSRYKKVDVGNRLKLVEDVLKDATAVDDSNTITLILHKLSTRTTEHTQIFIWNTAQEETPFDEHLYGL